MPTYYHKNPNGAQVPYQAETYPYIGTNVHLGTGVIFGRHVQIGANATIGSDVYLQSRVRVDSGATVKSSLVEDSVVESEAYVSDCDFECAVYVDEYANVRRIYASAPVQFVSSAHVTNLRIRKPSIIDFGTSGEMGNYPWSLYPDWRRRWIFQFGCCDFYLDQLDHRKIKHECFKHDPDNLVIKFLPDLVKSCKLMVKSFMKSNVAADRKQPSEIGSFRAAQQWIRDMKKK